MFTLQLNLNDCADKTLCPMKTSVRFLLLCALFFGVLAVQARPPKASRAAAKPSVKEIPADTAVSEAPESFGQRVFDGFMKFYGRGVSEKLYLQTDKPYYSAGENIWFKGFLVNAITLTPTSASKYIYVELIDRRDSLVQRVKIKADEWGFHNCLKLSPDLPWGDYCLRAYTQWMQNDGPDYFFERNIRIVNPIDDAVNLAVDYGWTADSLVEVRCRLTNSALDPLAGQRLVYSTCFGGRERNYNQRTDDRGEFRISFAPPADSLENSIRFVIDEPDRHFDRTVYLPAFSDDFDVQFFPEGGHLIPGPAQLVAFKAIGSNGLGVGVKGRLLSEEGEEIAELESEHLGMGRFNILAQQGKRYYAELTSEGGKTKRFELPPVAASGCSLRVAQMRGRLLYQVYATPDVDLSRLGLIVHSRGKIMVALDRVGGEGAKAIGTEQLPEGITHFALVDKATGAPVSERLVFVRKRGAAAAVTADKPDYYKRERVELKLKVTDSQGNPAAGTFALSVTDRHAVVQDSTQENILSGLLLSSDLKGYIESPGWYFRNDAPETLRCLDLLMLTQGWTRFSLPEILKGDLPPKRFAVEESQSISGSITGFFGGAAKRPSILIFSPTTRYLEVFQLEGSNRFNMSGLDFADSTSFILQAMNKSGGTRSVSLNIRPEVFPSRQVHIPRPLVGRSESALPEAFLNQSKERYYYEGGMRVIDMREVVVTTQRRENKNLLYNVSPTRSIPQDVIDRYVGQDIYAVLQTLPGVRVIGHDISVRNSTDPPLVYIDEMAVEPESLDAVNMADVQSVDLVAGPEAAIFGLGASGGVILISLKDGASVSSSVSALPSLAKVQHLGYKKPEQFYQPKYEVAEVRESRTPDLRTTICWDPRIKTDSTGVATVSFYTADRPSTYDVTLEGVTQEGELCRRVVSLERRK